MKKYTFLDAKPLTCFCIFGTMKGQLYVTFCQFRALWAFPKKCTLLDEKRIGQWGGAKRKEKVVSVYGYARISAGKGLKVQVKALSEAVKEENIVTDAAGSGGFCALLGRLQAGDLLVVSSLEALGGSYEAVLQAWKQVTGTGADIRVLDLPLLDTRQGAQVSGIVQQVLGFAAERDKKRTSRRGGSLPQTADHPAAGVRTHGHQKIGVLLSSEETGRVGAFDRITDKNAASQKQT